MFAGGVITGVVLFAGGVITGGVVLAAGGVVTGGVGDKGEVVGGVDFAQAANKRAPHITAIVAKLILFI